MEYRDLRDIARYVRRHGSGASTETLHKLADAYLELQAAVEPLRQDRDQLRQLARKLVMALGEQQTEVGPIIEELTDLVCKS